MSQEPQRPPRRRVDLRRTLSGPAQTALALVVVGVVVGLAWWQGRDRPVPAWITEHLVPALGWAWIVLAVVAGWAWWRRRRAGTQAPQDRGDPP